MFGVVTNCMRCDVFSAPSDDSQVVCTLDTLTEVMIDHESGPYYRIYTANGLPGFCRKRYIAVKHQEVDNG